MDSDTALMTGIVATIAGLAAIITRNYSLAIWRQQWMSYHEKWGFPMPPERLYMIPLVLISGAVVAFGVGVILAVFIAG